MSLSDIWQEPEVAQRFLDERSLLIPHREEQLGIMVRMIRAAGTPLRVLDVGCGSGVLLGAALLAFPEAQGVGVDYSPPMLAAAREKLAPLGKRAGLVAADLGSPDWLAAATGPFDTILSGYCIHHLPDDRKRVLYEELYGLLSPGGAFVHAEHVASATPELEALFDDAMSEHLWRRRRERGEEVTLEQVRYHFLTRPDRAANILAPVETQLAWLREIGFVQVDCTWKWFELAIFGGQRPR
jgi:tRNA (cmo5U34)-methyltransferase